MISTTFLIIAVIAAAAIASVIVKLLADRKKAELSSELKALRAQKDELKQTNDAQQSEIRRLQESNSILLQEKASLQTQLTEQAKNFKEQLSNLEEMKKQMKLEFEALAQGILEAKGSKFSEQSKEQLNILLNPFKTQLESFRTKVEEIYDKEGKERFSLTKQIEQMHKAYENLSEEANNLVKALKADTKTQGDWGEINLRRILDFTGLKEGVHYYAQSSYKNETGENLRPDFVVNLPDNRQIVVDSKVSLTGYEKYFNAENDSDKETGIREHLKSVRRHVIELAEKKYDDLKGINTLDFVLMFIPVEAAYFVAIDNDSELYKYASEKKVLLVCPSTLLITLQLVGSLWRIDDQKKHVYEIAELGGRLYDKFVGFVSSLSDIKKNLDKSLEAYQKAHSQLTEGKGNLISQAQRLVTLGVKAKSKLPEQFLPETTEAENVIFPLMDETTNSDAQQGNQDTES